MLNNIYLQFKTLKFRDIIVICFIAFVSFFVIGEILARIFKEPTGLFVKSENEKLVYELNTHHEGINDTHVCNYIQPKYRKLNSLIHKSRFFVRTWKNILYSPFGRRFLFEWIGSHFPDALLAQEGLVGTRKAADDEIPAHKPHPP